MSGSRRGTRSWGEPSPQHRPARVTPVSRHAAEGSGLLPVADVAVPAIAVAVATAAAALATRVIAATGTVLSRMLAVVPQQMPLKLPAPTNESL